MVDKKNESGIAAAVHSTRESDETPPHFEPVPSAKSTSQYFGRSQSLHDFLGSGIVADIVLWRKKQISAGILVGSTLFYILFEWVGYTLLSVLSTTVLFVLIILFIWSNLAALVNRPPPPIPEMQLPEEKVHKVTLSLHTEINRILTLMYKVSLGRDWKLFLKVVITLYVISVVGGFFDFLTLVYTAILMILTLPPLYEKYGDELEKYIQKGMLEARRQYKKIDDLVLSKIPKSHSKEKKVQ